MPDQREVLVRKMVEEGTSDEDIRATLKVFDAQQSAAPEAKPAGNLGRYAGYKMIGDAVLNHPVATGAAVGSLAAAPFTGGASLLAAGLGSAGGAGLGEIVDQIRKGPKTTGDVLTSMGTAGTLGAAGQGVGMVAGPALRLAKNVGPMAMTVAEHLPVVGRPIRIVRGVLRALESMAPEAPAASANAGGRLVKSTEPTAEQAITDALKELRAPTPPAKMTTPPPPQLPAGYTPRATVPKPTIAAKPAAPAAAASAPKRAYFLKPLEEMSAASEPVAPTGRAIGVEDLPAAWRSRIAQPLLEPQGAIGAQLTQDAMRELQGRGLSVADALDAVTRNPQLAPNVRLSLREALMAALGGSP